MLILAAPFVVVASAVIALLLLFFRCWRTAATFFLLSLGINAWTEQIPLHIPAKIPAVKPEGTLRVLEYNICGKASFVPNHGQPFLDYVKNVDADIIFLPENSYGTCFEFEKMLKSEYPYSLHDFPEFEASQHSFPDQTLYSRFPISDYHRYELDLNSILQKYPELDADFVKRQGSAIMAFEVTADVNGTAVTVLHVHLRTNSFDYAKEKANGKRSLMQNVYEGLLFGYAFRAQESEIIARELSKSDNPLLVCGDFNDFAGSRAVNTIQNCRRDNKDTEHNDRLLNAWWEGGLGFGFTFTDQHLLLRLDHILYSKEFILLGVEVQDVPYSDHLPLIADFAFKP